MDLVWRTLRRYGVPEANLEAAKNSFGGNIGAGFFAGGQNLSIRGDVRYFKHIDNVPSTWRFAVGVTLRLGS